MEYDFGFSKLQLGLNARRKIYKDPNKLDRVSLVLAIYAIL